ncbi:hypothetical protein B0H21DRAFT_754583 [Amylocystis lapponica]|nr:hypothetical protein B0H21DRAFT_754583 [Amylocystis lapponica]
MTKDAKKPSTPSLFDTLLTPGSSLHPTLLLVLDCAFALLLIVFVALAFATRWNVHLLALITIECALWASVKWFVHELQKVQAEQQPDIGTEKNEAQANTRLKDE